MEVVQHWQQVIKSQDIDTEFLDILYASGRGNESVVSDGPHPVYEDIDEEFFDILQEAG